ncbi:hypothetical protein PsYK624_109540 [Phanerochaete sordida]|uniref:Small RNA 2'-O-methyltransferase n=1 Tax=Phanerochaete sordida TaxID=48140 RepID=A0A9P3LGQ4_9APHY|nr:hypothetical protein PsYK624_109540 [Phanerochaete sordida]
MSDATSAEELSVSFVPALFLQRRGWVFDQMRRAGVTQVIDIGCGEGETVACLCNPAPWRGPLRLACADGTSTVQDMLHIHTIHALDVELGEVRRAADAAAPPADPWFTRWEPLDVTLWHGGLEAYNAAFVGAECIVSTEVIEHLPEDVLAEFAPLLLGVYHPQLLLLTTPSYDFNARFTAPDAPPTARRGTRDPTGRTARVFRHSDHKFEWTRTEFRAWCDAAASEWGYDVDVSGVGRAQENDPFGRDDALGPASQVAAFRRRDGDEAVNARAAKSEDALRRAQAGTVHSLVATHHHDACGVSSTSDLAEISNIVKERMQQWQETSVTVHEIWFDKDIDKLCAGALDLFVSALEQDPALSVSRSGERVLEWAIQFHELVLVDPDTKEDVMAEPTEASEPESDPDDEEVQTPPNNWKGWQPASMAETDSKLSTPGWGNTWQASGEGAWGARDSAEDSSKGAGW